MRAAIWQDWSCTVEVIVTDPEHLPVARQVVRSEMAATDRAASRFRPDSEVSRISRSPRPTHLVSPVLADAVSGALWAAAESDGLVDPTLGRSLIATGYDRDISAVRRGTARTQSPPPRVDWRSIRLEGHLLSLPPGTSLDLGASAKALAADRAASQIADRTGGPVLVSIGGDLAIAGQQRPWAVEVCETPCGPAVERITAYDGGLATSSVLARTWPTEAGTAHHLIDPRTGLPPRSPWRTVTVAASSCLAANVASTAAVILGEQAPDWLVARQLPARLVHHDGTVLRTTGWPTPGEAAA